jgi:Domain of unknown function (DUF4383)
MSLSRMYALVFGAVYLLVGLVGLAIAPGMEPRSLVIFDINLAHNLVHIVLGIAGLAAYFGGFGTSRIYAQVVGVVLLVVALAGFLPQPLLGVLPIGGADIILHALTGALGVYSGFMAQDEATSAATAARA